MASANGWVLKSVLGFLFTIIYGAAIFSGNQANAVQRKNSDAHDDIRKEYKYSDEKIIDKLEIVRQRIEDKMDNNWSEQRQVNMKILDKLDDIRKQ